ncbi:MAG: hypothetical protein KKH02_07285 [Proteobacteria bacterium]|nr:hypothetical protein [Pseudomonadota bacterium]MBU4582194.1 hypothetical protein [Pseudomonadota bacterium]MCG2739539.1 hypothetical protein [Syntrophaceae bacterium]
MEIVIPPRAGHFPTLQRKMGTAPYFFRKNRELSLIFRQGTPKNLQCALPGSGFQVAQRSPCLYDAGRLFPTWFAPGLEWCPQKFAFDEDADPYYEMREMIRTQVFAARYYGYVLY